MGSNTPFEKQTPEYERPQVSPDLLDLDSSLRRLAGETHPQPAFVARLRGDLEQQTAAAPRRPSFSWTRPLFAQAALLVLLVGLVALALGLAPHLQRRAGPTRRLPHTLPVIGLNGLPTGAVARLGKGRILALDSAGDGRLAVGATTGVCVYQDGVQEQWCAWTEKAVLAVAFNPAGDVLAIGLSDGNLQILDAGTGQVRAGHTTGSVSSITALAWDPTGAPVVASITYPGQVSAWNWQEDVQRWAPITIPDGAALLAWAQGAGGESILAAAGGNELTLLDGESGLAKTLYNAARQFAPLLDITALDFSTPAAGEQPWLAYAYRGGVAALKIDGWQVSDTRNWPLANDSGSSYNASIAFSPQTGAAGLHLAVVNDEGVRLANVEDGTIKSAFAPPMKPGTPILLNQEGGLFFTFPNGMLAYTPASGNPVDAVQTGYTTFLLDLAWGDAGLIAANGPDEVRAWRTDSSQTEPDIRNLGADIEWLVLSPDGTRVSCVLKNGGSVRLWDLEAHQPTWTVELASQERTEAFSQDGKKLAIATRDGQITAYDVQTGQVTGQVQAALSGAQLDGIAWAPPSYGYDVVAAAWSRDDGSYGIDLASLDERLDWSTKQLVTNIRPTTGLAWGAGEPGEAGLLAAFQSEQAVLWDAQTGVERYRIGETPQLASVFFPTLAFSNNGQRLAISAREGISVWTLPDGKELQAFRSQENVRRLLFSPDGQSLASASQEGAILLWDLAVSVQPTPTPILPTPTPLPFEPDITPTAITPNPTRDAPLARLGSGTISALDAAPDGRLAVGTTAGVCLHDPGMAVNWCRWLGSVSRVVFNPARETLAVALAQPVTAQDIPLLILDTSDGHTLAQRNFKFSDASTMPGSVQLAWDPLGAPKIAIAETGGLLSVWDWPADQITWGALELSGPVGYDNQGYVSALDWSAGPGGESLLAVGSSLGLSLMDGATGELKQRYDAGWNVTPVGKILALAFAPDDGMGGPGRHLAFADENGDLYVLEMQAWESTGASHLKVTPSGDSPGQPVAAQLAWAPSTGDLPSMRLAQMLSGDVLTYQPAIYIYEPFKEGVQPYTLPAAPFSPIAWSAAETFRIPGDSLRALASLFYHDPSGMLSRYSDQGSAPYPLDYAFGPEALVWLAPGDLFSFSRRTINRWDVTGTRLGAVSLVAESEHRPLLAVSPDGQRAAYGLPSENKLLLWDAASNQLVTSLSMAAMTTPAEFQAAAFSAPDGSGRSSRLATATLDGQLTLWDASTGRPIRGSSPLDGANQINALALSPGGDIAAVAWTDDQSPHLTLYRFLGGTIVASIPVSSTIAALAWSTDGRLVGAVGGLNALIIDAASGAVLHTLSPEVVPDTSGADQFEPGAITSLAFSPDSNRLATGGRLVTLWDTHNGALLKTFSGYTGGHTNHITSLAFRPDGGLLASASSNGVILLWDLGAGPLPTPEEVPTPTPLP